MTLIYNIIDLVVGAHGSQTVFVLRSRPIASVDINIIFSGQSVSLISFHCIDSTSRGPVSWLASEETVYSDFTDLSSCLVSLLKFVQSSLVNLLIMDSVSLCACLSVSSIKEKRVHFIMFTSLLAQ